MRDPRQPRPPSPARTRCHPPSPEHRHHGRRAGRRQDHDTPSDHWPARPSVVRPTARGRLNPSRADPKAPTMRRHPVRRDVRHRPASGGSRGVWPGSASPGPPPRGRRDRRAGWAHRLQPATRASAAARSVAVSDRSVSAAIRIGSCVAWAAAVRGSVISLVRRDVVATGSPGWSTGGLPRPPSAGSRASAPRAEAPGRRERASGDRREHCARRAGRDDGARRSHTPLGRARRSSSAAIWAGS